ncbi:MAG: formylmethanofuran--tetrahydromethanopterin N-formyltransferase [Candidatus Odinarchaeota archaeon]|nr:formylmethanofuran--tetrahydromethanopterin N-formyltransferase [Candidatus Odinarchaeota archaeon]
MFPMWASRILITADNEKWALTAAQAATGFGTSIIMSPAEAGIERIVPPDETPDGRVGAIIQIYHRTRLELKVQMIFRIGQCILTCPTTAAFDALPEAKRKVKIGPAIRKFGDGFEVRDKLNGRDVWRIPVMEGEFIIENLFGVKPAIAGGNFLILAKDRSSGLKAAEEAVEAIKKSTARVVLTFPGGICRSGSKVGSLKYKLPASTNHFFCPTLKDKVPETALPKDVNSVYEIVINGLTVDDIKEAMAVGIKAAASVEGVKRITAANYGGKLGPYKIHLKDVI